MAETILGSRYEILRKIGDGGMAFVYEAKDRLLNRNVAIKVLRPEFVDDEEFLIKFKREAEAVASLSHPNIVNVYDVGEDGKVHYIVMEFVDGKNLKEIIQNEGTLDEYTALDITKQIAQALGAAHKKGIIHRDIKPHNILISNEGRVVKVADFGIAKAVSNSTVTNMGSIIGSVHYFSPEQAKGKFVTNSSDLYSLGIVLYEMLLGKVPFRGDSPISIALQHINDEVEFTSEEKVRIPQSIRTLIRKLTEKVPSDRYQTAEELVEDIDYIEKNIDLDFIKEYNDFETKKIDTKELYKSNKLMNEKINPIPLKDMDDEDDYDDDEEDYYEDDYDDDYDDEEEDYYEDMKQSKKDKNKKKKKKDSTKSKVLWSFAAIMLILILGFEFFIGMKFFGNPFADKTEQVVPNIVNMSQEEAKAELDKIGVKFEVAAEEYSSSVDKGNVITQNPESGTSIKKGETVIVVVSKGDGGVVVPDVTGHTLSQAKEILASYDLELGRISYEFSDTKKEGIVLEQTPSAGAKNAEKGDSVSLVVSKGKEETETIIPDAPTTTTKPDDSDSSSTTKPPAKEPDDSEDEPSKNEDTTGGSNESDSNNSHSDGTNSNNESGSTTE
ncbi:MAG: Stk1 family PASTA domain-containing Ser/Thr kinase [Clostridioides sp.]|nr:Stk1 family PASTA domain-containing Ser/Thr kinase [Clostridioides sp.]